MIISVICTSHNRKQNTLRLIKSVFNQTINLSAQVKIFLVDDGSTDGTYEEVSKQFPAVSLTKGSGLLFWAGGMRAAFNEAVKNPFDFLLWVNDDIQLEAYAIEVLINTFGHSHLNNIDKIVIGACIDSVTKKISYGGVGIMKGFKNILFKKKEISDQLIEADTFNGNLVLVSKEIAFKLGNLDSHYTHHFADFDYGLRASKKGIKTIVAPGHLAICDLNFEKNWYLDNKKGSVLKRWEYMLGPKGLPLNEWWYFCKHYNPRPHTIRWAIPYLKFWFNFIFYQIKIALKLFYNYAYKIISQFWN